MPIKEALIYIENRNAFIISEGISAFILKKTLFIIEFS
jgi:hypothetical protein